MFNKDPETGLSLIISSEEQPQLEAPTVVEATQVRYTGTGTHDQSIREDRTCWRFPCPKLSFHSWKNGNLEKEDDLPLSLDYLVGKPELNPRTLNT